MWRFSDVAGTNSVPVFRVFGCLVEPELMTKCPTLRCAYHRSASHWKFNYMTKTSTESHASHYVVHDSRLPVYWKALHSRQWTALAKCNDLLTLPTKHKGRIPPFHQLWFYQTTSTPWRRGQSQFPKRQKTTSWLDCLPAKISLNSVVAKVFRLTIDRRLPTRPLL